MTTPVSTPFAAPAPGQESASPTNTPRSPAFGQVAVYQPGQVTTTLVVIDPEPEVTGPPSISGQSGLTTVHGKAPAFGQGGADSASGGQDSASGSATGQWAMVAANPGQASRPEGAARLRSHSPATAWLSAIPPPSSSGQSQAIIPALPTSSPMPVQAFPFSPLTLPTIFPLVLCGGGRQLSKS